VLVAALVAGIAVAAAVVIAMWPRSGHAPEAAASAPPASAPATSAPAGTVPSASGPTTSRPPSAKAPAGPAPTDVRLQDNRDSVSLAWAYPKGSEGPVLISGGRVGQAQRAFQQLPAGTTTYLVYGLNQEQNYCFTVAVVYARDRVASSPQVCTARRG
jgi:hypothetical protein